MISTFLNSKLKKIFWVFAVVLLVYMILPGPSSITNFAQLPDSYKSKHEGDTIQVPNVAAYYSFHYRDYVTNFYKKDFQELNMVPLPPIRLNYPPEAAFTAIKKHTESTYLEEFIYPLRDSLYVNGFEPFYENGDPKYWGATQFFENGVYYPTKTTIRFYPAPLWSRVITWLGICISIWLLGVMTKKIIFSK